MVLPSHPAIFLDIDPAYIPCQNVFYLDNIIFMLQSVAISLETVTYLLESVIACSCGCPFYHCWRYANSS